MDPRARFSLQKRLAVFEGAIWCILGAILLRYGWIQIVRGSELKRGAMEQAVKLKTIPAPRGLVLDRNGNKLIENTYVLNMVIENEDLPDLPRDRPQNQRQSDAAERVGALAKALHMEADDLKRKIVSTRQAGGNRFLLLKDNLDHNELAEAEIVIARFPFVSVQVAPRRVYVGEDLAGNALGYVGEISKEALARLNDKNFRQGDIIGQDGLEASYDDILRGKDGLRKVVTDYLGREVAPLGEIPSIPGETVYLTLDSGMQSILRDAYGEENGAAVVLDLRDGGILAMYSSPSFDPNAFMDRRDPRKERYLSNSDGRSPMFHRAIKSRYAPGSTAKLLTALAALEHGIITPQTRITCTGTKLIYGSPRRCTGTHGSIDLHHAITVSCNHYFFELGTRLDVDQLHKTALKYGLADKTGVDLPGEMANLIPSRAWKERSNSNPINKRWYAGDTVMVAVGQGNITVTPLSLARFYATLALKGKIITPHILFGYREQQTQTLKEYPPHPSRDAGMEPKTWELINEALANVVRNGTARGIYMPNLDICGKTGTAQVAEFTTRAAYLASGKKARDHAWFAGYAPKDNPQIAWAVMVENGGFGSSAAAPIAQKLCKYWFFDRKENPLPPPVARTPSPFYALPGSAAGAAQ